MWPRGDPGKGRTRLGDSIESAGSEMRRAWFLIAVVLGLILLVRRVADFGIANTLVLGAVLALVVGAVIRRQQREQAARDAVAEILHSSDDD